MVCARRALVGIVQAYDRRIVARKIGRSGKQIADRPAGRASGLRSPTAEHRTSPKAASRYGAGTKQSAAAARIIIGKPAATQSETMATSSDNA